MELIGNAGYEESGDGESKPVKIPGMHLGIRDVPTLAPFLREDRLILAVHFWRSFHPSRTLTGTRELLAWALRRAAKRELVDRREWQKLDATQVDERIAKIIAWARERKDKTETELLLESLEDLAKCDASWFEAEDVAWDLSNRHERRAVAPLAYWLRNEHTEDHWKERILHCMGEADAREAKPYAVEYLDGKGEPRTRAEAAFILHAAGDRERAFQVLGEEFPKLDCSNTSAEDFGKHLAALAKDDSPQTWDILGRLFDAGRFATIQFDSADLCRLLETHGRPNGLQAYRKLLDDMGSPYRIVDELLESYASHDPAAKKILAKTKKESEERRKATCDWLDARIKKVMAKR